LVVAKSVNRIPALHGRDMWNITSSNLQRAKDELMVRRTESETRYAEEKQALDAELAVIEALERAASEFMLRHTRKADAVSAEPAPPTDPPGAVESVDAETGGSGPDPATPSHSAERSDAEAGLAGAVPESAPPSGDTAGGLDILKPGSRWRFYRSGNHPADAEANAGDMSSTDG
jgi:hypothetical protein